MDEKELYYGRKTVHIYAVQKIRKSTFQICEQPNHISRQIKQ